MKWSKHNFNGNPERVHIVDPISYQDAANTPSYLGNRRTTFFAQGDDQPAGTNQGANQLINTAKNLDWLEARYRSAFSPPTNVPVEPAVAREVNKIIDYNKQKNAPPKEKKTDPIEAKAEAKAAKKVEEKKKLKEGLDEIKNAKANSNDPKKTKIDAEASASDDSASDSESDDEQGLVSVNKFDTCAGGSCQTPQWPGETPAGQLGHFAKAIQPS